MINSPIEVESITSLLSATSTFDDDQPDQLFRGESKKYDNPCQPSLFRRGSLDFSMFDGSLHNEYARVREWQRCVEIAEGSSLNIATDIEMMVIARHHNVDVRLLDWSSNPLVACWFAADGNKDEPGYLYTRDILEWGMDLSYHLGNNLTTETISSDRHNALVLNPFCLEPEPIHFQHKQLKRFKNTHFFRPESAPNTRLIAQSGYISIHPNPDKDDVYKPFANFVIPTRSKRKILSQLDKLGINERALGLSTRDGIANRLNKIKNGFGFNP